MAILLNILFNHLPMFKSKTEVPEKLAETLH